MNEHSDITEAPNFEGHEPRECGDHRTVGSHRAWCHECGEWCYPSTDGACKGCRLPALDAEIESLRVQLNEARSELAHQATGVKAELARRGLLPHQTLVWWSPDTDSDIDPKRDPETVAAAFAFIAWLSPQLDAARAALVAPTPEPAAAVPCPEETQ